MVTTQAVRLKGFRLKAEGVRRARLWRFGEETADFCIKHGFKIVQYSHFSLSRVPRDLLSIHLGSYL